MVWDAHCPVKGLALEEAVLFFPYTTLFRSINQVLMQIKDEGALTFLGKLKGDPNKRPKDRYCRFHRDHGHDTADYYDLK